MKTYLTLRRPAWLGRLAIPLSAVVAMVAITIPATSMATESQPPALDRQIGEAQGLQTREKPAGSSIVQEVSENASKRGCRLACVRKQLANLTAAFNDLSYSYWECELLVDVTQYDGYDYANASFQTTALDFTEEGDFADEAMVVYDC
jgi:hypothetical protein